MYMNTVKEKKESEKNNETTEVTSTNSETVAAEDNINQPSVDNKDNNLITINKRLAEDFIVAIQEVQELKELSEQILDNTMSGEIKKSIQNFNTTQSNLQSKFSELITLLDNINNSSNNLSKNISDAGSYSQYLEEKIKCNELSALNIDLQQNLQKQRISYEQFQSYVEVSIREITTSLNEKLKDINSTREQISSALSNYNIATEKRLHENCVQIKDTAENQLKALKSDAELQIKGFSSQCKADIEVMIKSCTNFLSECNNQNQELIKKIPKVDNNSNQSFGKKDWLLLIVAGISIVSCFLNFII